MTRWARFVSKAGLLSAGLICAAMASHAGPALATPVLAFEATGVSEANSRIPPVPPRKPRPEDVIEQVLAEAHGLQVAVEIDHRAGVTDELQRFVTLIPPPVSRPHWEFSRLTRTCLDTLPVHHRGDTATGHPTLFVLLEVDMKRGPLAVWGERATQLETHLAVEYDSPQFQALTGVAILKN